MKPLPSIARLHEVFSIDIPSGKIFRRVRTGRSTYAGEEVGSPNGDGYLLVCVDKKRLKAHRVVFAMLTGAWPRGALDHANGIKSDNRFTNLREATSQQNSMNASISARNTSGVKGVHFHVAADKWAAQIQINGRTIYLGVFQDIEDAKTARYNAERVYFRQFSSLLRHHEST